MSKKQKQPIETEVQPIETEVQAEVQAQVAEVVKEVTKARGIGKHIVDKILTTNLTNKEILDDVIKNFDGAKTTMACIAWYKTKMRKEGKIGARVKAKVEEVKVEEVPA